MYKPKSPIPYSRSRASTASDQKHITRGAVDTQRNKRLDQVSNTYEHDNKLTRYVERDVERGDTEYQPRNEHIPNEKYKELDKTEKRLSNNGKFREKISYNFKDYVHSDSESDHETDGSRPKYSSQGGSDLMYKQPNRDSTQGGHTSRGEDEDVSRDDERKHRRVKKNSDYPSTSQDDTTGMFKYSSRDATKHASRTDKGQDLHKRNEDLREHRPGGFYYKFEKNHEGARDRNIDQLSESTNNLQLNTNFARAAPRERVDYLHERSEYPHERSEYPHERSEYPPKIRELITLCLKEEGDVRLALKGRLRQSYIKIFEAYQPNLSDRDRSIIKGGLCYLYDFSRVRSIDQDTAKWMLGIKEIPISHILNYTSKNILENIAKSVGLSYSGKRSEKIVIEIRTVINDIK